MLYADGYRRIRIARPSTHASAAYAFVNNSNANGNDDDTSRFLHHVRDVTASSCREQKAIVQDRMKNLGNVSLKVTDSTNDVGMSGLYILYEIYEIEKR